MKKVLSFLFALLVMAVCGFAQKPDVEKINTTYTQFPDKPLVDSIKTYAIQVVNLSKTETTLRLDEINKYLKLEGFRFELKNPDMIVTVVINDVTVELGSYAKGRSNGVPVQFVYTATAKLNGSVSFTTPNNKYEFYSVTQLDKPEDLSGVVESPTSYVTEDDAKKAQGNDKTLNDKAIREAFNTGFKNIGVYLNKHHGYPVKSEYLPVWGIKSKGTDYQDFDQAVASYQAGIALVNQPDKKEEMKTKFKESIVVWEKAVGEYNPSSKDARISSKNILEVYANLTLANTWIENFEEAKRYYALAEKEKGLAMWKPYIQELLVNQEIGAAQDQIRKSGKLKIEKKLCALYRSPEFIPGNEKFRIKYIISYTDDQKYIDSRKVFEYDENGFLIKVYEQRYKVGSKEFYGMSNIQNLVYNHHENTITVPNPDKSKPAEIYTIKQGKAVRKIGMIEYQNTYGKPVYDFTYYPDGTLKEVSRDKRMKTLTFNKENGKTKSIVTKVKSVSVRDTTYENSKFELEWQNATVSSFTSYFNNEGKNDFGRKGVIYTCMSDDNGLVSKITNEHERDLYKYDANKNLIESARFDGKRYTYE